MVWVVEITLYVARSMLNIYLRSIDIWVFWSAWFCEYLQVESFNIERALRKIKRYNSSAAVEVSKPAQKGGAEFSSTHVGSLNFKSEENRVTQSNGMEVDCKILQQETSRRDSDAKKLVLRCPWYWSINSLSSLILL